MVATSPLSAEKKRADHPVLCGDGGWRKRHTHFMVHVAYMYRGSTAFVNSGIYGRLSATLIKFTLIFY